jgi:hypothetical protein
MVVMKALVIAVVILGWTNVHAGPTPAPKPWAVGVSDEEQTRALAIYKQANAEFEEARYAQALAMYRDAIKHWDHPAIRFNMVVCLVNLDHALEALDDLESALKYGDAPLGAAVYAQGLTYRKLLLGQLAKVVISSHESNAEITLDGAKLFTAPGTITKVMTPGNHQIVATKPGFLTTTMSLALVAGKDATAEVTLTRLAPATIVTRWSPWKPWLVVAGGAALSLTGGYLEYRSYENFASYNASFATACPNGCGGATSPPIPASLPSLQRRARIENATAVSMFVVGGLALAAGAIGVYINQPRSTLEHDIVVTPTVAAGAASLVVAGSF